MDANATWKLGAIIEGKYRLCELLARGGQGDVYAAEHVHTGERVALKCMSASVAGRPELVDRMVEALAWQVPMWIGQGYGQPYPATYIRNQRWTDEQPVAMFVSAKTARTLTSGAAFVAGLDK